MKQWREIGGKNWMYCESESWFRYCENSPEHDTREVEGAEVYPEQFKVEDV